MDDAPIAAIASPQDQFEATDSMQGRRLRSEGAVPMSRSAFTVCAGILRARLLVRPRLQLPAHRMGEVE
ncbi:MAG: hypothetical protein MUP76_01120, partial [Acidimicrobiia bacterium]|nr:hypothetical protein [Acidimicrobiia bacterium]